MVFLCHLITYNTYKRFFLSTAKEVLALEENCSSFSF